MKHVRRFHTLALATLVAVSCSKSGDSADGLDGDKPMPDPNTVDSDADRVPDGSEDRNRNGTVDPGETDPGSDDTDGDGIPDGDEVQTIACAPVMDRPFRVYDAPGAESMILVDGAARDRKILRTPDNKAPAIHVADPDADVAAVLLKKTPNGATPADVREHERRTAIAQLGNVSQQRTRTFTTVEGFAAEQATWLVETQQPVDARGATALLGSALLGGVQLAGILGAGGRSGTSLTVKLLTILRSPRRVVLVAAVALNPLTEAQEIRLEEFTDGTNVARHGAFTRHICDPALAKSEAKADIIFVVDDSGSMEDDQQAIRDAANEMEAVLASAQVDFRLGVTRTMAQNRVNPLRGRLEGRGLTPNVQEFKDTIVVGARGGWEPGLETGILAYDRLLPKTPAGQQPKPDALREGAATIVIHMSDERDQAIECTACGACDGAEHEQRLCTDPSAQPVLDDFIQQYTSRGIVTFALVGDLPNGCRQMSTRTDFEPGQGYVEIASATGGQFGSLCGDMRMNLMDVGRVASGVASAYKLTQPPASATIRVASGQPGQGRAIPRSRTNGFDYDGVQNSVIFYGDARPKDGDEVVIGYRRWDWADNPLTPPDPCDECEVNTSCLPELDTAICEPICGEVICDPGLACLPETGLCGDPAQVPPATPCGECDAGLVCDPSTLDCVPPCETTGCDENEICNPNTHLCGIPQL